MATLRNKFHELGNWHNKISLVAIVSKEILADIDLAKISKEELAEILEKSVKDLTKVVGFIAGADKCVDGMKSFIYEKLGGDTEIVPKSVEPPAPPKDNPSGGGYFL